VSTLNVDKVDPSTGTDLEIGTSGDTITVPTGAGLTVTDEVKTNKISPATGTAFALGDSGDTFTVPSGATIVNSGTATGFGINQTSFLPTANPLIINGDFAVAQRNSGTVAQSDGSNEGYATVDRWQLQFGNNAGGTLTTSRDNEAPTGFGQSYKLDCTTADASVGATHIVYSYTTLESQTIRNSGWDYTSSSSYLTLSFWVRSSKTGIYCVFFQSNDGTSKMYTQEYTVSVADTWEKKVITLPGDSGISFDNDNGSGLGVAFVFAVGTDRDGTAGAWTTGVAYGTSNQVNFLDSTSNVMYITGVQLEVGEYTSADLPPFRHESYGDNLLRCSRYYTSFNQNGANGWGTWAGQAQSSTQVNNIGIPLVTCLRSGNPTLTKDGGCVMQGWDVDGYHATSAGGGAVAIGTDSGSSSPYLNFNVTGFSGLSGGTVSWSPVLGTPCIAIDAEL
jgi:hypothetical protein